MGLQAGDALIIVDVQNDFCPGGALAVPEGDRVIPAINSWIAEARRQHVPIFASRDWHPPNHISFKAQSGIWPTHCVQGSGGAEFHASLKLTPETVVISKGTRPEEDSYSAFGGTDLANRLRALGVRRVWIGGLALDYCVKETALDARRNGFETRLIRDATRAVNVHAGDAATALADLRDAGVEIDNVPAA
jgi:nicotinamidase/pyrazinamidase